MTFEINGGSMDNEVISIRKIAEMRKAAAKIKPMLNLNMIILGGSGTGKSRFYVKPNLMQCNTSFIVTDPSGELLQSCGKMLERKGYKIKVFNINDMKHSSNYNPFHYLKDNDGSTGLTLSFIDECDGGGLLIHIMQFGAPLLSVVMLAVTVSKASEITKRALGG